MAVKQAVLVLLNRFDVWSSTLPVLVPTDTNDDVNGSQDSGGGGTDFTYRTATWDDVDHATTLGFYEYFSVEGDHYTGHYYNGDRRHFDAIVVNPPAYAATVTV